MSISFLLHVFFCSFFHDFSLLLAIALWFFSFCLNMRLVLFHFFAHIPSHVSVHWRALVQRMATKFTCDERREITCSLSGVHFAYSFFSEHKRIINVNFRRQPLNWPIISNSFYKAKKKFVLIVSPNRAMARTNETTMWFCTNEKEIQTMNFSQKKSWKSTGAGDDWKIYMRWTVILRFEQRRKLKSNFSHTRPIDHRNGINWSSSHYSLMMFKIKKNLKHIRRVGCSRIKNPP